MVDPLQVDVEAPDLWSYWELPREHRLRLLRWGLLEALALVTDGEVGPEEFDQEVAIQLASQEDPVFFERGRFRDPNHRARFHAVQKRTFLALIAPYRWKKRGERVVSYADKRWQVDESEPGGRTLVRRILHSGPAEAPRNREEDRAAFLLDLTRAWDALERRYSEPIVLAAVGVLSCSEAARHAKMRKSRALALIRQAQRKLAALELPE